jgi:hypothetical protein
MTHPPAPGPPHPPPPPMVQPETAMALAHLEWLMNQHTRAVIAAMDRNTGRLITTLVVLLIVVPLVLGLFGIILSRAVLA